MDVLGTLEIIDTGIVEVTGTTTIFGGGKIEVFEGGQFTGGVLDVQSGGVFEVNRGTALSGVTTFRSGGGTVRNGGAYTVTGALTLEADFFVRTGSSVLVNSTTSISGVSDTVLGVTDGSTFTSTGAVTIGENGRISVDLGSDTVFDAMGTSTFSKNSRMDVASEAIYNAHGAVVLRDNSRIVLSGGTFNAFDTTMVNDAALLLVADSTYTATGKVTIGGGTIEIVANGVLSANGGLAGSDGTADTLLVDGTLNISTAIALGTGDDLVSIATGSTIAPGLKLDGGGDTDILRLTGSGTGGEAGSLTLDQLTSFERIEKQDSGFWTLIANNPVSVQSITVEAGSLVLLGTWIVTGNTTTVDAGATLDFGVGTTDEAGDADISGTLNVLTGGTFNVAGTTTVFNGGTINVNAGGTMSIRELSIRPGGTVNVSGDLIGTAMGEVLRVNGSLNAVGQTIELLDGSDELILEAGGSLNVGLVDLGSDNDKAKISNTVWRISGRPPIDGGDDTDSLEYFVNSGLNSTFSGGDFTNTSFLNFEKLIKTGGGSLTLESDAGGDSFETITVSEGTLVLIGIWNVTGNTTDVGAGTTLAIGDGAIVSALNETQDLNVLGTLEVIANGTVIVGGTTSVTAVGQVEVLSGGVFTANGPVIVNGAPTENANISVLASGIFNATSTTTISSGGISVNGTYNATGAVLITSGQLGIFGVGGTGAVFTASGATMVAGTGVLITVGGIYNANGALSIQDAANVNAVVGGAINATGPVTISGNGALNVGSGGQFNATQPITQSGGSVFGSGGTINGVLNNTGGQVGGVFIVAGAPGTLSIVGAYNQGAGGTFLAGIQPGGDGASDLLVVQGTTTLAGGVEIVTFGGAFGAGDRIRLIATDNPISGIFDSAIVTGIGDAVVWVGRVDDAGAFNAADPATGNNVDVLIGTSPTTLPNLTPNQTAIADSIGRVFTDIAPGTVVIEDAAVYDGLLVSGFGPAALDQLSPEVYDSFTAFSFNIARQYGGLVDNRVRTLRCAAARGPSAPFCGSGQTLLADAGRGLAPGASGTTSPNGFSPNTHPYGWSVWAQAIGSYISLDRTSDNLGYSGWTGGGALGIDLALSQRWIVGVMAGGTRSNIDYSGVSADGDLEAVTVGVYTAWYGARWFANAAFTYSKTWVEADRDLTFMAPSTTAKGKTEGDQYAAHATVGYGFKVRKFSLEATGGIDWVQLRQYGFTETGAGAFNLTVGTRTDDSLRLRVGIRVARAWKVRPSLIIAPSLRVGYAREVLDNTRPITSSLAGFGGSFTVNGDEGSRNILTYGGGVQADFSQGITLYFRHSGEWAGDRTSHTFNGGVKLRW